MNDMKEWMKEKKIWNENKEIRNEKIKKLEIKEPK